MKFQFIPECHLMDGTIICTPSTKFYIQRLEKTLKEIQETVDDEGMGGWLTDLVNEALTPVIK